MIHECRYFDSLGLHFPMFNVLQESMMDIGSGEGGKCEYLNLDFDVFLRVLKGHNSQQHFSK